MYYITNQTNQIIAADESLLELLHLDTINDLTEKIILQEVSFTTLSQETIQITTPENTLTYTIQESPLSSMIGTLNLVILEAVPVTKTDLDLETLSIPTDNFISTEDSVEEEVVVSKDITLPTDENSELTTSKADLQNEDNELFDLTLPDISEENQTDDDIVTPKETLLDDDSELFELTLSDEIEIHDKDSQVTNKENFQNEDNELFDLTLPNATEKKHTDDDIIAPKETPLDDNSELFELTIPETLEENIDEITVPTDSDKVVLDIAQNIPLSDETPIVIDVPKVSENIGISTEDYNTFLNEYIDTAISLEQDLQSTNEEKRSSAIGTLTQLADILQLPQVNDIMKQLSLQPENNLSTLVESFYHLLSRLSTIQNNDVQDTKISPEFIQEKEIEEDTIVFNTFEKETIEEKNASDRIVLDDIKPVHFDFQLEEAANDLSLPVELIEEFVHDFIEQAHIETKKMLQAYEKGDLDSIQKIGHLLKGASSNLRINALSDTLYDIQFCDDINNIEDLIKRYWAHFLSFEQQINIITK